MIRRSMKPGLLIAIVAALLLLGALVYWNTRAEIPATAGAHATPPAAAPSAAPDVRLEAARPDPESPTAKPQAESRTAAASAEPTPVQESADAPPPLTDMGDASAASLESARAPESAQFEEKYRKTGEAERKKSRLAIEDTL